MGKEWWSEASIANDLRLLDRRKYKKIFTQLVWREEADCLMERKPEEQKLKNRSRQREAKQIYTDAWQRRDCKAGACGGSSPRACLPMYLHSTTGQWQR